MDGHFLRIKKLTGKGIIEVAARHNHREIMAELGASHIDPERVALNRVLRGPSTAAGVATEAKKLMSEAGVKALKRTAVMSLEVVFSLPPDTCIDQDRFFDDAVEWTERHFNVPIISAIVHNDEAAPHCHVLLLPLVEGRMVGSDLMGGRAKLLALHSAFHANVAEKYGMRRQTSPQKGYSLAARRLAARMALDVLRDNGELCGTVEAVMDELFELIAANPAKLLSLMGRQMPTEKVKPKDTFVGIMTRPSRPEPKHKPIGLAKHSPMGLRKKELTYLRANSQAQRADSETGAADPSLSCVGNRLQRIAIFTHSDSTQCSVTSSGSETGRVVQAGWLRPGEVQTTKSAHPNRARVGENRRPRPSEPRTDFIVNATISQRSKPSENKLNEHYKRRTNSGLQAEDEGGRIWAPLRLRPSRCGDAPKTRAHVWRVQRPHIGAIATGRYKAPTTLLTQRFFLHTRGRVRVRDGGNNPGAPSPTDCAIAPNGATNCDTLPFNERPSPLQFTPPSCLLGNGQVLLPGRVSDRRTSKAPAIPPVVCAA